MSFSAKSSTTTETFSVVLHKEEKQPTFTYWFLKEFYIYFLWIENYIDHALD